MSSPFPLDSRANSCATCRWSARASQRQSWNPVFGDSPLGESKPVAPPRLTHKPRPLAEVDITWLTGLTASGLRVPSEGAKNGVLCAAPIENQFEVGPVGVL